MEKAILVTLDNKNELQGKFESEMPISSGYYLVAPFGRDLSFDLLTPAKFNELYTKGRTIENGFFVALRKPIEEE